MRFQSLRKTLCLCMAGMLLLSVPAAASPAVEKSESAETRSESSESAAITQTRGFLAYLNQYPDASFADGEIALTAEEALLDGSSITRKEGRDCLLFAAGNYAEWTVEAPRDAFYRVSLDYCAAENGLFDLEIGVQIDGSTPFSGADYIALKRTWVDDGEIHQGANGNEIAPDQKEIRKWRSTFLEDYSGTYNGEIALYLSKGTHTIRLTAQSGVALDRIALTSGETLPSYEQVSREYAEAEYEKAGTVSVKTQAELAYEKSDSTIIPVYDSTSAATENADGSANRAGYVCRNTIGQSRWEEPGMWISYRFTVPKDGLYKLEMRTKQNANVGMASLRDIRIDGELPFAEARGFVFPYSAGWKITVFGESEGEPYWIYLTAGEHEIRFTATLDAFSEVLTGMDEVNRTLTQLYRRIVMVTGISPDANRDYMLDAEIPGLMDSLTACRDELDRLASQYLGITGGGIGQVSIVKSNITQLSDFLEDPDTIPSRLSTFQSNISSLSDWLIAVSSQSLEIDYFVFSGGEAEPLNANASLLNSFVFGVKRYVASYIHDYDAISDGAASSGSISVWFGGSRDQAEVVQNLLESEFTPKTGISVSLSLVYQGYIESILAGQNPDVALEVARSYPVNLACRDAVIGLSGFDTYEEVASRFTQDAAVPYSYKGEVYGLPATQAYFMFFYRTDILEELGLKAPDTWDEFYEMVPTLERNNYEIGMPYTTLTVAGAAQGGIGALNMYATLLLQKGGFFYQKDMTASGLGSEEAYQAFVDWTELYTTYGLPVTYNLVTRFRSGTLPVFIAPYSTFNTLMGAAPEIRGLWDMRPVPGTVQEDGSVDRSTGASGTANVIFKGCSNPQACWDFLNWWTSEDVQYSYSMSLEALMGQAARSTTATIAAFDRLDWGADTLRALQTQRESVVEIMETPASYVVSRSLDNAFRSVVLNGKNSRERFEQEVLAINEEMARKQKEFE